MKASKPLWVAELYMVQDVVARPVVAGRHVDMNGSVGTGNDADNSVSANNNRSGNDILYHIKLCNPHGRLIDTSLS